MLALLLLVGIGLELCQGAPLLPIKMKPGTVKFYDSDNRQRIFHGLNVVYKGIPYMPIQSHYDPVFSFSQQDIDYFNQWGMNIIRFGFMWPGVEVANGTYNETYIQLAVDLVNAAGNGGIYTLIDAHQDVLSQKFCGEGSPPWAAIPEKNNFPEPLSATYAVDPETGFPSFEDCSKWPWSFYYFTEAAASAFQALYSNSYGLTDAFTGFWEKASNVFLNNSNVIGFELLNEPFAGDIFKNPLLMEPGRADLENLQPFYDKIAPRIHDIDPNRLVFFEPVTWSDLAAKGELAVGFSHVPGGEQYSNTSVLSFHYYVPLPNFSYNGIAGYFGRRLEEIANISSGGMLTETFADGDPHEVETYDMCDSLELSWIGWDYKGYSLPNGTCTGCGPAPIWPNGTLNMEVILLLSRTYAQAVAGDIVSMHYNQTTSDFSLVFTPNPECTLPTEIYLNEIGIYNNSYAVDILPSGAAAWNRTQPNQITVTASSFESNITVLISKTTQH